MNEQTVALIEEKVDSILKTKNFSCCLHKLYPAHYKQITDYFSPTSAGKSGGSGRIFTKNLGIVGTAIESGKNIVENFAFTYELGSIPNTRIFSKSENSYAAIFLDKDHILYVVLEKDMFSDGQVDLLTKLLGVI